MRKALALILASTFFTAVPSVVVTQPVEAASLLERLFPKAAERRRVRRQRQAVQRRKQIKVLRRRERTRLRQRRREARRSIFDRRSTKRRTALRNERSNRKKRRRYTQSRVRSNGSYSANANRVEPVGFKTYIPRSQNVVRFTKLTKAFAAHEKQLAAQATTPKPVIELRGTTGEGGPTAIKPEATNRSDVTLPVVQVTQRVEVVIRDEPGVGEQEAGLRLSLGSKLLRKLRIKAPGSVAKAVVDHYASNPTFVWIDEQGQPTAKANRVLKVLEEADAYALNARHYDLPKTPRTAKLDPQGAALLEAMHFEFALTVGALRYANDARHGVVDPNRVSGYHDFKALKNDHADVLSKLAALDRPDTYLIGLHPDPKIFKPLLAELKRLSDSADGFISLKIRPRTYLRPGGKSDQLANIVEVIRRKSNGDLLADNFDAFALDHGDGRYGEEAVRLVRAFQEEQGLRPDGIIGPRTLRKLTLEDPRKQRDKVRYAIERLRWHPDQLGDDHVLINQPAFKATLMRGGRPAFSTRTVVGTAKNQTNFFHDEIEYVEYNPYWGIPKSILVNEMLPKLRRNSSYFDGLGYEVTTLRGKRIRSSRVDWWSVDKEFPFNVRQPPGPKNALGQLKIMFPNRHSIYMHDTPAKHLFSRSTRAYSHGCVRLAEPQKMAAAVLGTSIDAIASSVAQGENRKQKLKTKLPVYVSYFTAWPDVSGKVNFYKDIYGRDKALETALRAENRVRSFRSGT